MLRTKWHTVFATFILVVACAGALAAQPDSVDVTFIYTPGGNPSVVFLPGEFNNWGPNSGGSISGNAPSRMDYDAASSRWVKTVRLRVGGPLSGGKVAGAYQYKFNENGSSSGWLADPLNPRQNPSDNNNSVLYAGNPVIHYLLPNSVSAAVNARFPRITAYIHPAVGDEVDASSITVFIDDQRFDDLGASYDPATRLFSFTPDQPVGDGSHTLKLMASTTGGSSAADSTIFEVHANAIQILTRPGETRKTDWRIRGVVFREDGTPDGSISSGVLSRGDSSWVVSMISGAFDTTLSLLEGENVFQIEATVAGSSQTSAPVTITRIVNHAPFAEITFDTTETTLTISAAKSTDPDPGQTYTLQFLWKEDTDNPASLGISGQSEGSLVVPRPTVPGEFYVNLRAQDTDGNQDSTEQFVRLEEDGRLVLGSLKTNPAWVGDGRIYILFFKGLTPEGTIRAAMPFLEVIRDMGFSIIWVLPVMENAFPIDNREGPGYNIVDFFNVAPEYGTNQDFRAFVARAHDLGMKVILDFTPNHSSRFHPFADDARRYGEDSPYWPYYQHRAISHNTNDLGQAVDPFGFYYYGAFSDQLLNWDWSDLDGRAFMLKVLKHWLLELDLDGYRLDVYWGPHRRYGPANFDRPLRRALKHVKPDILILGEDDGTGVGTERIYADHDGGVDVGYDFKLFFNQIRGFGFNSGAVNGLHSELVNGEYIPGTNSYFFRFMETQDEDRISYVYDSFEKTMPMAAVLFTAPGIPGIMQGQEVGYGKGISGGNKHRVRKVVDFNFAGRALLLPHYQKLAQIRGQFPAFRQHKRDTNGDGRTDAGDERDFIRVSTGEGLVYAFVRPYLDHNGLTLVNFSNTAKTVTLDLTQPGLLKFTGGLNAGDTYVLNNLYTDLHAEVSGDQLRAVRGTLEPYGSAVFVISREIESMVLPPLTSVSSRPQGSIPGSFNLYQNFPNPFNPETWIQFDLPRPKNARASIYNLLGRRVRMLLHDYCDAGVHRVRWDGEDAEGRSAPSGVYFVRLEAGEWVGMRKILLVR